MNNKDYLIHYGVLGMKWGVRKDEQKFNKNKYKPTSDETLELMKRYRNSQKSHIDRHYPGDPPTFSKEERLKIKPILGEEYSTYDRASMYNGILNDVLNDPNIGGMANLLESKDGKIDGEVIGALPQCFTNPDFVDTIMDVADTPEGTRVLADLTGSTPDKVENVVSIAGSCRNAVKKGTDFITGVYDRSIDTTKSYIAKGEEFVNGIKGIFSGNSKKKEEKKDPGFLAGYVHGLDKAHKKHT